MASTAARVQAHIDRSGGLWGGRSSGSVAAFMPEDSYGGSATANSAILVEANLDGLGWTKMPVRYESGININRGRSSEGQVSDTATCSFTIDNRHGYWSPRNPNGPYFGYFGRNTQVRVWKGSQIRFYGEISEWPQRWDTTGSDIYVPITASSVMRRIGQSTAAGSAMYQLYTSPAGILNANGVAVKPVAYWPMEDPQGSTSLASALPNGGVMTQHGNPQYASYSGYPGSDPLPNLGGGANLGQGNVGATRYVAPLPQNMSTNGCVIDFLVNGYINTEAGAAVLFKVDFVGGDVRSILFSPGGAVTPTNGFTISIQDDAHDAAVTSQGLSTPWPTTTIGIAPQAFQIIITQSSTHVRVQTYGMDISQGTYVLGGDITFSAQTNVLGRPTAVQFNPFGGEGKAGGQLQNTYSMGHVAVFDDTVGHSISNAPNGYGGETADARFARIVRQNGFTPRVVGGTGVPMGYQADSDTFSAVMRATEASDCGIMYEARDISTVAYRTCQGLTNQSSILTLDYANAELSNDLEPTDDDLLTCNDMTVSRNGGSSSRFIDSTSVMGTGAPPNGVGVYQKSTNLSLATDVQAASLASWLVHMGTVNESRYPQVTISLQNPRFVANADLTSRALVAEIGDRIEIKNPPSWLPPDNIRLIILGYTETFDQFYHTITFNCAPESPYHTGKVASSSVASTTTSNKLDSAGSTVNSVLDTTSTSMSVAVATGNALWSTTASSFDIMVNGERMTVTGVSGSSSPQTFTVTRSVNGIVKSHKAGEKVSLYRPAYVALPASLNFPIPTPVVNETVVDVQNNLNVTNANVTTVQNSVPILRSIQASATGSLSSFTSETDVPGATVSFTVTGSNSIAKIWGVFDFSAGGSVTFTGRMNFSSVGDFNQQAIFVATASGQRATVTQAWEVTGLTAGTYTAKLRATCSASSSSNTVNTSHTGLTVLVLDTQT